MGSMEEGSVGVWLKLAVGVLVGIPLSSSAVGEKEFTMGSFDEGSEGA